MAIRKIKANEAVEKGDYIQIKQHSTWFITMVIGVLIGGFISMVFLEGKTDPIIKILVILFFASIGAIIGDREEVRKVPKADLVEIKEYSNGHVTVVLDDERVKHQTRE